VFYVHYYFSGLYPSLNSKIKIRRFGSSLCSHPQVRIPTLSRPMKVANPSLWSWTRASYQNFFFVLEQRYMKYIKVQMFNDDLMQLSSEYYLPKNTNYEAPSSFCYFLPLRPKCNLIKLCNQTFSFAYGEMTRDVNTKPKSF
jgi:hypothetical protein